MSQLLAVAAGGPSALASAIVVATAAMLAGCGSSAEGGAGGAGGGFTTTNASSSSTGASRGGVSEPCEDPTPLLYGGVDTGFDTCAWGLFRRREILTCPPATEEEATCCEEDCGNGFCVAVPDSGCICISTCASDDDCGADALCLCTPRGGECTLAHCRSASDCAEGEECVSWDRSNGCDYNHFVCTTPDDTCRNGADCPEPDDSEDNYEGLCIFDESLGHRLCDPKGGGCG